MSEPIEVRAVRVGRQWAAERAVHGVYPHGRTLAGLQQSMEDGLALLNVHAEVTVIATSPVLGTTTASAATYAARPVGWSRATPALRVGEGGGR
ncbi:hypothetical protein [Streptomyces sp. NPDC007088]|uniref:hypothetical protein n=1 Tax=Streptomyces sp. NPDC007088 TaxID=3364773 RepID=UPI0036B8EC74